MKKKVLLIGWDAADWKIITPLLQNGKMPNLQNLMNKGSSGTVQTLEPALSPMLWTSIATGKTADKHGVLGFIEPDIASGEARPASVTSRNGKAVWNILSQNNFKTNVVGWWPSHPAEPVNGIYVSNMFTKFEKENGLISNSVHPSNLSETIAKLRVFADEITLQQLVSFVSEAETVNQDKDKHLHSLASLLANCNSIQNVGKYILKNTDWDFTGIYFDTIDQISHTFMKFYSPQMVGVPDDYFKLYNNVISQMYIHHDTMLGELIECAGDNVTTILLSDHGFYSNHLRPVRLPNDPASPSLEHAPFGIICMSGAGVKQNEKIKGATLLDITPTILQLFDLPMAEDMDGKVLQDVLVSTESIEKIKSWENVNGNAGLHAADCIENSWHSTEAMFQMMELGYIEKLNENKELALKKIVSESHYYLSSVLISIKKYDEALPLLAKLVDENKSVYRYGLKYATCLQHLKKNIEAREVVTVLKQKCIREIQSPEVLEAVLLSCENKHEEALELLVDVEQIIKHLPHLYLMIGNEFVMLNNFKQAEINYLKALQLDEQNTSVLKNLIYVLQQQNKETETINAKLSVLTNDIEPDFENTLNGLNNLDFNPDQTIDFRKYQLIIRLFLEQFHKGVKNIN